MRWATISDGHCRRGIHHTVEEVLPIPGTVDEVINTSVVYNYITCVKYSASKLKCTIASMVH